MGASLDNDPTLSEKARLRATMRRRRIALAKEHPEAARAAARNFPSQRLSSFKTISGYHPLGGEIDPAPLMARFAEAGATLALPAAVDRAAPLAFRLAAEPFVPDAFGIPAPTPSARVVTPDLIITPVLAFDRRGGRLGQGAGCYDRTLAALRAACPLLVLGLAYAGQEVAEVPAEPHDQRLDAILTEEGYIEIRKDIRCA
jgi:5-formyltetrahydrofolate cyclo-ligase